VLIDETNLIRTFIELNNLQSMIQFPMSLGSIQIRTEDNTLQPVPQYRNVCVFSILDLLVFRQDIKEIIHISRNNTASLSG